jgi:hypothetical protein
MMNDPANNNMTLPEPQFGIRQFIGIISKFLKTDLPGYTAYRPATPADLFTIFQL